MNEPKEIELLNKLEEIEYTSIQWGYVDGCLDENEVYDLAEEIESDELVELLLDKHLLFEVENGFRTRFGESVRLLSHLKQIFPNKSWQESPNLVSDLRVQLNKRFYPKREIEPIDLLTDSSLNQLSTFQKEIYHKMTQGIKLSKFQADATSTLLEKSSFDRGVIITAGTGSGKTLSFYLPTMLKVVNSVEQDRRHWTRVLTAYPRIELLRDQLTEALATTLKIAPLLTKNSLRSIKIGALYGAVPNRATSKDIEAKQWKRSREKEGWICPILNCPKTDTPLVWLDKDIDRGIERLVPEKEGVGAITLESKYIALTRESLLQETPDILFITLEMLNKRLSDFKLKKLFGIGKQKSQKPFLILLDEVHTYIGTTGTQSALLLRRWRQALTTDNSITFVGLSATLNGAERFFSELTNIYPNRIKEISPKKEEMIEEGAEYQIVLKGDPLNHTGLLSTTIQTIMLMGRVVDPMNKNDSYYGQKVFAFTDDLDVTNRLFDDFKDAEGWDVFNRNDPERGSLAILRDKKIEDNERYSEGQDWRMCEEIGHNLSQQSVDAKLSVSRTSSQDKGVDAESSVIIATASLEVGFNDPMVGVVVQHKSPHNWANFLQRKGRAGRKRGMRPFMITTLSDFGRDRVAFNHYEQFFEPRVEAQRLPIGNRYILKIQATITLFDWLSQKVSVSNIWMFKLLSQPTNNPYQQKAIVEVVSFLEEILNIESDKHKNFINYLKYALGGVSKRELSTILWNFPRPLMLEVIPTLLRRLKSNYKMAFSEDYERYTPRLPLPEFVTATLFSDLALPEVDIVVPLDQDREQYHTMPLLQAMREFAPGRISRRFATSRGNLYHWIPIDTELKEQSLELGSYCSQVDGVATVTYKDKPLEIFRVWEYKLSKEINPLLTKRSNSLLSWNVAFNREGVAVEIPLVKGDKWSQKIDKFSFYLNKYNASVETIRYAPYAITNLSFRDGGKLESRVNFLHKEKSVGVGFSIVGDGVYIQYKLPTIKILKEKSLPLSLKRELKIAWFKREVIESKTVPQTVNSFDREKIQEILLDALIILAKEKKISLLDANLILENDSSILFDILNKLYPQNSKDYDVLYELLSFQELRLEFYKIFKETMVENNAYWQWIREAIHQSFAQSLLIAFQHLTPKESAIDTLLVDTLPLVESEDIGKIWISESSGGGVGVLETLVEVISSNPNKFFQTVDTLSETSEYEKVINGLEYFLDLIHEDKEIRDLALDVSTTKEHKNRQVGLDKLYKKLSYEGIVLTHSFKVSLNSRILKEGIDETFLQLLRDMLKWRDELEERLEIAIDSKTLAFLLWEEDSFSEKIEMFKKSEVDGVKFLSNILWSSSFEARWQLLKSYSPFESYNNFTDPKLFRHFILEDTLSVINLEDKNPIESIKIVLAKEGICRIKSSNEQALRDTIIKIVSTPIDIDFLQLFTVVVAVKREKRNFIVTLKLKEEW